MFSIALGLLLALPACTKVDQPPELGRIRPEGYAEKYLPKSTTDLFLDRVCFVQESQVVWSRCFNCDLSWEDLQIYLTNEMAMDGWTETTADWLELERYEAWGEELRKDYLLIYSSPSGQIQLYVINVKRHRFIGGDAGTSGDYFILAGYDDLEKQKKAEEERRR